ncbi:lysine--tRNA ligase, partial [Patescibacteria group bacterium]|nr:lysine--tRNA ligase [Patescibacteria group bacterium]
MFWADELVNQIAKKQTGPHHVDDMKTPSGRIHVGALRGVAIHGLIQQLLKGSVYTYIFNDMDPMDGFPQYLPDEFRAYMGRPLCQVPSPEKGFASLAECYAKEFVGVFKKLGFRPKVFWSSQMYQEGRLDEAIRVALDKAEKVRQLYRDISGYNKPASWHPFQVICPQCGLVGSTMVTGWDGEKVSFECRPDLVDWCKGCGHEGKISPFGGTGKLMWKVDWAAHWKVIGVTIEGAGKDHMTKGGSYDLSKALCWEVFDHP